MKARLVGRVTTVHAGRCRVLIEGEIVDCRYRGRLGHAPREEQNLLVVGDFVRVETADAAVVVEVLPRESELSRTATRHAGVRHVLAANVDQVIVVAATKRPALRTGFIDRCLAASFVSDIPPAVCINKMDLVQESAAAEIVGIAKTYRAAGIRSLLTSALTKSGVEELARWLGGRTSVLIGQSGVGKSSLLNAVNPELRLKTGEVSHASMKGRHTTPASRLLPIGEDGFVVDTPGVRAFGLDEMTPPQVALAYPEFVPHVSSCRFSACSHFHEPDCGVRRAVEAGEIQGWRYANYCRILDSMRKSH